MKRFVNLYNPINRPHPLNRGLIAWWLALPGLTGGNKFCDLCKFNHMTFGSYAPAGHGEWHNFSRPGGYTGIHFNASGGYGVANIPSPTEEFTHGTMSAWIFPHLIAPLLVVVSNDSTGPSGFGRSLILGNSSTFVSTWDDNSSEYGAAGLSVKLNKWNWICASHSPGSNGTVLYRWNEIDGFNSYTINDTIGTNIPKTLNGNWYFGSDDTFTYSWDGLMDDIRIIAGIAWTENEAKKYLNESLSGYTTVLNYIKRRNYFLPINQQYFGNSYRNIFKSFIRGVS